MNEENNYIYLSFDTFLDIGTYIIEKNSDPKIIMKKVLQELLSLHSSQKIKLCDSEIFSISSDEVDPNFNYYISEEEIFCELEQ